MWKTRKIPKIFMLLFCGFLLFFSVAVNAQTQVYREDFIDENGNPDTGDWVSLDALATGKPGPFFEAGTYGSDSVLWCGKLDPGYTGGSGYGNNWDMWVEKEFDSTGTPGGISFDIQYDTEPGYDYAKVQVSYDGGANWTTLEDYSGMSSGLEHVELALTAPGAGDPPIRVRFAFRSDGAWSDEDGHNPTDGAFRLDNVRVIDVDGVTILDESTFDTGLDGWMPGKPASPGEYVLQPYEHWSDYGPRPDGEGYAWTAIEQPNGVFPAHVAGEPYWNVGIESPRIEIPADADAYLISFDVYRQLPLFEGLFYYWAVAVPAPEDGGVWRSFNTVYYGDRQAWFSHGEDISILTTPGATSMRLRLQARYFPQFFWPRPSGVFTGPGPIFGGVTVLAQTGVQVGSLDVRVFEDEASGCPSPGGGLYGVTANVFDATGAEVGTFVTDIDGFFNVPELDAGDYQVSVVRPLGYSAAADELAVTVVGGETALAEFPLDCAASTGAMRGMGYWKHQVNEALGGGGLGRGRKLKIDDPLPPDIDSPICDLLDLIVVHFNDNAVNEVRVYDPTEGATCTDKLDRALSLLNLPGSQEMVERARQHFMVLLLNTASGYINPTDVVSDDGATLSQAITYCDNLIDDQAGDHESAMGIAEMINNGDMVPAGMIPLDTVQIAYRHKVPAGQFLLGNKPNPFNPSTTISFVLPETGSTTLKIYDVSGHLVRTLLNGTAESQGLREVVWNGKNEAGRVVAAGVYFCKLDAGGYSEVRRMTLVK